MVTQSDSRPTPVDNKPENPATATPPQLVQPITEDRQNASPEATKGTSQTSVFVNSEPIREEQVRNAVSFLSHPRVKGTPVIQRRSFLERKGLTKEEIDEAFCRVPDPSPAVSTSQPAAASQDGQLKSSPNVQPQGATLSLQPAPTVTAGGISRSGTFYRFHWSHALLAIGLFAASGAGTAILFKKSIIPRLKSWVRKIITEEEEGRVEKKPSLAEEATAAAKAAAAAAADVARASQEMLISKREEKRYFEELSDLLTTQVREMKSMSNAIQKLEASGQGDVNGRIPLIENDYHSVSVTNGSRHSHSNGGVDHDTGSVRSLSPPASAEPSVAPHPKSYMEIMAMIQRGEKPANIKEINDLPPNPNQPVPDPRVAPRPKPWEVGQVSYSSNSVLRSQGSGDVMNPGFQDSQSNGDGSTPWWQRKNVRITEIESEGEQKLASSTMVSNERPVQRTWVPPQPPPVAMPEAAEAIRQQKKPLPQKELLTDDKLLARSSEISEELQNATATSESGGMLEANGGSSGLGSSDVQKEAHDLYYEG